MADPKVIPALADLTQDIAGPVPVRLLQDWAAGKQDLTAARTLLDPFRVEGTVVDSDAAGLSKMSEAMNLIELIALISRSKEILHALGVEIGGRAIGVWVADNTEMYYPPAISSADLVEAMWEAQARIAARNGVRFGLCIHRGSFYEIGGGLYGPDAEVVERLAEDHARGGEILVTRPIREELSGQHYSVAERIGLEQIYGSGVYTVTHARGRADLQADNRNYPHPYTDEFIGMMNAMESAPNRAETIRDIYARFLRAAAVVFVVRDKRTIEGDLAWMLDTLLSNALLETIVRDINPGSHLVSCGGGLAVLVFVDVVEALDFAREARLQFERNGLPAKIGIDYGSILFFEREGGGRNLVGEPANTASKISEDSGRPGTISITARAAALLPQEIEKAEPFQVTISNIEIRGYWI